MYYPLTKHTFMDVVPDVDDLEERGKIETSTSLKRLELMAVSLAETKAELAEVS